MAKVYQANEIKNIALMGGSGSGKTTLMESMLFECGVIKRRGTVETNTTVCDYFPVEKEYGYSVFSTVCNIEFNNKKMKYAILITIFFTNLLEFIKKHLRLI